MENEVPISEKVLLTLREAAEYFHIGQNRIREIAKSDICAECFLRNGNRLMIKRKLFEKYIDETDYI